MNQALVICTASFKLGRPSYRGVEVSILLLLLLCVLVSRKAHHWHTIAVRVVVLTHTHLRTQETTTHHHTCAHTHTLCILNLIKIYIAMATLMRQITSCGSEGSDTQDTCHCTTDLQWFNVVPSLILAELKPLLSKALCLNSDLASIDRLASRHACVHVPTLV